ncbi:MAG: DNA repair protein RecO C-terminal domain-containing protein, partial [Clostridiales bacterium]|nr:DNA repair protein RecO C-terminal domain-containing protein [Clostridiales bacterium]
LCTECAAGEGGMHLKESTLYAMQFILLSPIEKLYTFQLTEPVLCELEAAMREYMACHVSHDFKSLKVIETL